MKFWKTFNFLEETLQTFNLLSFVKKFFKNLKKFGEKVGILNLFVKFWDTEKLGNSF